MFDEKIWVEKGFQTSINISYDLHSDARKYALKGGKMMCERLIMKCSECNHAVVERCDKP